MNAEEILTNRNMFAGKIMQELTHDELKSSIDELFGAIGMRGGKLEKPFVLLCKKRMSAALKEIYPSMCLVEEDDASLVDDGMPDEIVCIVINAEKFPEHYIVLSDLENMRDYLSGASSSPKSALLAVKGFNTNKDAVAVYAAEGFENIAWDIIGQIAEVEFSEREHDSLSYITVYSDFMMYSLMHLGFVSGREPLFLGRILVKLSYNSENKGKLKLSFKSGKTVMLMSEKDYEKASNENKKAEDAMKNDMMSAVLEGMFGK